MSRGLTRVTILFLPERVNDRLRFGAPAAERIIDRRCRIALFEAGAVFAYVQWPPNRYGTELCKRSHTPGATILYVENTSRESFWGPRRIVTPSPARYSFRARVETVSHSAHLRIPSGCRSIRRRDDKAPRSR